MYVGIYFSRSLFLYLFIYFCRSFVLSSAMYLLRSFVRYFVRSVFLYCLCLRLFSLFVLSFFIYLFMSLLRS